MASWRSMTEIAGSGTGSGSISQSQRSGSGSVPICHGSATLTVRFKNFACGSPLQQLFIKILKQKTIFFYFRTPRASSRQAGSAAAVTPLRSSRRRAGGQEPEIDNGSSPPKTARLESRLKENQLPVGVSSPSIYLAKLSLNSPDVRQPLRQANQHLHWGPVILTHRCLGRPMNIQDLFIIDRFTKYWVVACILDFEFIESTLPCDGKNFSLKRYRYVEWSIKHC